MKPRTFAFKWMFYFLLLWLVWLAQDVFPLRIYGVRPLPLPVLAVLVATFEGPWAGAAFGYFAGLFCDALNPHTTVYFAIVLLLFGWLVGAAVCSLFRRNLFTCLLWSAITLSITIFFYWFFYQLMSNRGGLMALLSVGVPELLCSLCTCLLLYWPVKSIARRYAELDERVNPWGEVR